jgi:hypothetical protein
VQYAAECDLLKPYSANFSIRSKIGLATFAGMPRASQPSSNLARSLAISAAFFLPIARRNRSAPPSE